VRFIVGFALPFLYCANPVDDDPVQWESKAEIPVTNDRFILGEEFDNLFDMEGLQVLRVESTYVKDPDSLIHDTTNGDIVAFSVPKKDTTQFETHEESFEDKTYHDVLGPLPLAGAPVYSPEFTVPARTYSSDVPIDISQNVAFDGVYAVEFHQESPPIEVTVENNSAAALNDVEVSVAGLGNATIGNVAAGASGTGTIVVAEKSLGSSAQVGLTGTIEGNGATVGANETVAVQLSLKNALALSLDVTDNLVKFNKVFINEYDITDTVAIDYIDISDGFFNYYIENYTSMRLRVTGHHLHLWTTPFCVRNNITKIPDLANFATAGDSLVGYSGQFTQQPVEVDTSSARVTFDKINLSSNRLMTMWDSTLEQTVTLVAYDISNATPTGARVKISANDSLIFTISPTAFKFREFYGISMMEYNRDSDTESIAIKFPWHESAKDSLRNKFILSRVFSDVKVAPKMPDRAFIDTFTMYFEMFDPKNPSLVCSTKTTLEKIKNDTFYIRSMDITDIVNQYPDTVYATARITVPKGTPMRVVNDIERGDPEYDNYIGRMIVHTHTNYRLNADLDWRVDSTVNMDLGIGKFTVPGALRYFRKMTDRRAEYHLNVKNYTNVNMYLFALVAPQGKIEELETLDANVTARYIANKELGEDLGYVNLLGPDGVLIPPRNSSSIDTVQLNEEQLSKILESDTCAWRWQLRFLRQNRDSLLDTDSIRINSWIYIDGTNSMDSLLIW